MLSQFFPVGTSLQYIPEGEELCWHCSLQQTVHSFHIASNIRFCPSLCKPLTCGQKRGIGNTSLCFRTVWSDSLPCPLLGVRTNHLFRNVRWGRDDCCLRPTVLSSETGYSAHLVFGPERCYKGRGDFLISAPFIAIPDFECRSLFK